MAAKKETTKKKNTGKKVATNKKATPKKVAKVTEEQLPKIVEEITEPTVDEKVDLEKFKDEKGEYDLTKATEEEVKSAFNQLDPEDKIFVTKTEVKNGDPAVLGPVEPTEEEIEASDKEAAENVIKQAEEREPVVVGEKKTENITNKITKKFNQYFGYLWNGQAIDY